MFMGNNCGSFHLWWKENLVKHQKSQNMMKMIAVHILNNWSSCIYLIFTSQSSHVIRWTFTHNVFLHTICYYQTIYVTLKLKMAVSILLFFTHGRVVWHCQQANTDHIRKAICWFNWERGFANKDISKMVKIFNQTIQIFGAIIFLMRLKCWLKRSSLQRRI